MYIYTHTHDTVIQNKLTFLQSKETQSRKNTKKDKKEQIKEWQSVRPWEMNSRVGFAAAETGGIIHHQKACSDLHLVLQSY